MVSLAPNEWEENFQDLSGWCSQTPNMNKQQLIADPAELNTPVIDMGWEELTLNVTKAETNSVYDTEEIIAVGSTPDEPSMNLWLSKSNSPLIDVESVEPLGTGEFDSKDAVEDTAESFLNTPNLVSLSNWEPNSRNSNALHSDNKISVNKTSGTLTNKPKLKLNIPSNSSFNCDELSTPNIVSMLVELPQVVNKKPIGTHTMEMSLLGSADDLLKPLVEKNGEFDLLAYVFEDTPNTNFSPVTMETEKNTCKEEHLNIGQVCVDPKLVQKPCGKPNSIGWKTRDIEKPCSSTQRKAKCKSDSRQFSVPIKIETKDEDSSDDSEMNTSKVTTRRHKPKRKSTSKCLERPSKRCHRSTSSSSNAMDTPLDIKYRELRDRNNEASKRSRYNRKIRDGEMSQEALRLENENHSLKIKAEEMERLVKQLRESLLKTITNRK